MAKPFQILGYKSIRTKKKSIYAYYRCSKFYMMTSIEISSFSSSPLPSPPPPSLKNEEKIYRKYFPTHIIDTLNAKSFLTNKDAISFLE